MADVPDYEPAFAVAVGRFWGVRDTQIRKQLAAGRTDAGTRGAVTGGGHLGPIEELLRQVLLDAGTPPEAIVHGRQAVTRLPGYFREMKQWDLVVMDGRQVVLTIECKSQVGSFGNNHNNRIEEAIGQSVDYWHAAEKVFGGLRPWFGYVMIVEESTRSTSPIATRPSLLPPDPAFRDASYLSRYALAFARLYQERLLDAVVVAQTVKGQVAVSYPDPAVTFQHFAVALHNRVREYEALRPD